MSLLDSGGPDAQGERWPLELAMLNVDGELVAVVLGLVDHGVYRIVDTAEAGTVHGFKALAHLEFVVLDRVLDDRSIQLLDWSCGADSGPFANGDAVSERTVFEAAGRQRSGEPGEREDRRRGSDSASEETRIWGSELTVRRTT
ncbi:MAG: hypothetical protein ACI8TP_004782 [Acidimicrobiales bacterium]|jgi:hypothetical protein